MLKITAALSSLAPLAAALGVAAIAGCSGSIDDPIDDPTGASIQATSGVQVHAGKQLFDNPLSGTNGRSCATCHTESEHTMLRPASVVARLAANPHDPLFNRLDADDPGAATPTYEHLKRGLVRVTLPLPANMDLLDSAGNVVTPPGRTISVWRGVPTVENLSYTAPYQFDGRSTSLPDQALSALHDHSEISHPVGQGKLDLIAAYESSLFSSNRAKKVAHAVAKGVPLDSIPSPEDTMPLTAQEKRGRTVFNAACASCHGGATGNMITNHVAHAQLFFHVDHAGNIIYVNDPVAGLIPSPDPHPDSIFSAPGYTSITYLGQIGAQPGLLTNEVDMPRYRLRFYTDGTRTTQVTDLPPIPVTASGEPFDLNPAIDPLTGAPITGPDGIPQWWSTDPGRCLISGDPGEFESFDIPQLRGAAHTAPYFHDNSHATLTEVIDTYSRAVLPFIVGLNLPAVYPPEGPGLPAESLTTQEKLDLLPFLEKL